jgi:F-type H+-transporting ATPase subunit delta
MFVPQCWARGFIDAADDAIANAVGNTITIGDAASEALDLVKVLVPVIRSVRGQVSGTEAAQHLESLIRGALAALPESDIPADSSVEPALGLVLLLVKKQSFKHIERVIEAVEQELDARRGVLQVRLESVRPPEGKFLEEVRLGLMKKTGAAGIRLNTAVMPELLAGYRLRIGSQVIEASLRLHLRQMGTELAEMYTEAYTKNSTKSSTAHGGF